MRSDNITSREWWWVALVSGILVTLILVPYAWSLAVSDETYQFMGVLFNPMDGATYLSKMQQGYDGAWLFELRHTPEPNDPAGWNLFYLFLGHIARLLGLSNIVVYHVTRVATSFFMFFSLYQLGAVIWQRERPRRYFFLFMSVGSGLGWLGLVLFPSDLAPDLTVPEAFPILAAYTNPHFPLAIGCLALLATQLLTAFRPGFIEAPTQENGGLLTITLSVILAVVAPPALVVMSGTLILYTVVRGLRYYTLPLHEIRWASMVILPALPFGLYLAAVFRFNKTMSEFNSQNVTPAPNIFLSILGFGVLLFVAIPGINRALRRFEADGDQFMIVWFVFNALVVYTPGFALQRRLYIGLLIPIVYFAVRALEDYWLERIPSRWYTPLLLGLTLLILPSHLFTFGAPLAFSVGDRESGVKMGLLLDSDYIDAFNWLESHSVRDDVILAAPVIGLWIPAETHLRPVYGHKFETVPSEERLAQVRAFYRGEDCETLLSAESGLPFEVKFVFWGPREDELGVIDADEDDIDEVLGGNLNFESAEEAELAEVRIITADFCHDKLEETIQDRYQFGNVTVYRLAN